MSHDCSQSSSPEPFFFFFLPSHVSVLNSNCVSCYQILIFPPYAVLHKAQLLVSSRQPAHNQSNLFWVPQLRQINLLFTACPEIEGNTHHSRSGCVRVGDMGYFKKNSPLCCAADHSYQPPYQRSYQPEDRLISKERTQAPSPNQMPREEAAGK